MSEKTEEIKVRVTPEMKEKVQLLAENAGEGEAFIVREALRNYFETHTAEPAPTARSTSYLKNPRRKQKPATERQSKQSTA